MAIPTFITETFNMYKNGLSKLKPNMFVLTLNKVFGTLLLSIFLLYVLNIVLPHPIRILGNSDELGSDDTNLSASEEFVSASDDSFLQGIDDLVVSPVAEMLADASDILSSSLLGAKKKPTKQIEQQAAKAYKVSWFRRLLHIIIIAYILAVFSQALVTVSRTGVESSYASYGKRNYIPYKPYYSKN